MAPNLYCYAISAHLEATLPIWARSPGGKIRSARWQTPPGPPGNSATWHFRVYGPPGISIRTIRIRWPFLVHLKTLQKIVAIARWAMRQVGQVGCAPGGRQVVSAPGGRQVGLAPGGWRQYARWKLRQVGARWASRQVGVGLEPGGCSARWARCAERQVVPGGSCARWDT